MSRISIIVVLVVLTAFTPIPAWANFANFYNSPNSCDPDLAPDILTVTYQYPGTYVMRDFQAEVHTPQFVPHGLSRAAVIWSHGGGAGSVGTMRAWANATTEACYISVSLGHTEVSNAVQTNFCTNEGIPPDDCSDVVSGTFKAQDIKEMINQIEDKYGEIPIAVGGHSGGSVATMTVAGAVRALHNILLGPGHSLNFMDSRPEAFIALSPSGPHFGSFFGTTFQDPVTSWDLITRPMLTATGDGDNVCGSRFDCGGDEPPWNRRAPHAFMPGMEDGADPKYQLYIRDADSFHNSFHLSQSKCASAGGPIPQDKCDNIFQHLNAVVIAFLDAHLRDNSWAKGYLTSKLIIGASSSLDVEWHQK